MKPKITIIIGVLNMARYLPATLDSVVAQRYENLELIIMDGGSTDGTLDIIKDYIDHITIWKSGKDKGHSDACNKAIAHASGDLILLLNADDIIGENLLNEAAALFEMNPDSKMITCGVRIIENNADGSEKILQEITSAEKLQISLHNILFELPVINARFFHKNIFNEFGLFQSTHADGSYNLSNDRDFLIKLALKGVETQIIPKPLYFYLSHQESLTFGKKNTTKVYKEHLKLADKVLTTYTLSSAQKALVKSWQSTEAAYLCLIYLSMGEFKNSFALFYFGMCHCGLLWPFKLLAVINKSVIKKFKKMFSHASGNTVIIPSS